MENIKVKIHMDYKNMYEELRDMWRPIQETNNTHQG